MDEVIFPVNVDSRIYNHKRGKEQAHIINLYLLKGSTEEKIVLNGIEFNFTDGNLRSSYDGGNEVLWTKDKGWYFV